MNPEAYLLRHWGYLPTPEKPKAKAKHTGRPKGANQFRRRVKTVDYLDNGNVQLNLACGHQLERPLYYQDAVKIKCPHCKYNSTAMLEADK